ncbi:MAG: cation transporter [Prevotella sp.]|jgi:Cu(I)/Ag(I) efflux system membrane fusion protein|nr:cation transporter [Prevotella sp.]
MDIIYNNLKYAALTVQGNCEICKQRIENAALSVNGVFSATWNVQNGKLQIGFNPEKTNIGEISEAIAKVGHDTDKNKADKIKHDELSDCCK